VKQSETFYSKYQKPFFFGRVKKGLCGQCGSNLTEEEILNKNSHCKRCRDLTLLNLKKRLSRGLCSICGKKRDGENKRLCLDCLVKVKKRRRDKKLRLKTRGVELLGGKCSSCGISFECIDVYDFHHLDPEKKELNIGQNMVSGGKWKTIWKEMSKCILLCSNCHRILHHNLRNGA